MEARLPTGLGHPLRSLLLIVAGTAASLAWTGTPITLEHVSAVGYAWVVVALVDAPLLAVAPASPAGDAGGPAVKWPSYKRDAWIAIASLLVAHGLGGADARFIYPDGRPAPGGAIPPLHRVMVVVAVLATLSFLVFSARCWFAGRRLRSGLPA
jgi:hypothetical protein